MNQLYEEMEQKNRNFHQHKKEYICQAKEIILWAEPRIEKLNQLLKNHQFSTVEEEIHFFKKVKPKIMSRVIFYKEVLRIEVAKPPGKVLQNKYYKNALEKSTEYFKKEPKIYKYYRAKAETYDALYFTRNAQKDLLETENFHINIDSRITTCYDYKIAKIMAAEAIADFIEEQIAHLNKPQQLQEKPFLSKWQWTGSKTDLTELIYALHTKKSINNGNADIMEIATDLGKLLNVELKQSIYRNYTDIKSRKITKTKFLDALSESLTNKILEEER